MGSFIDVHMDFVHQEMPPTRLESVSSTRALALLAAALLAGQTAAWTYRSARGAGIWGMGRKHDAPVPRQRDEDEEEPRSRVVLVLDVDGTLYDQSAGVETQIVERIKQFGKRHFNLTGEECDVLHHKYGSTIAGLQATREVSEEVAAAFYREVWDGLDYSGLLRSGPGGDKAGYRHRSPLSSLLSSHPGPVVLASNSPRPHLRRVLAHMGLAHLSFDAVVTPEQLPGYPTKASHEYWQALLSAYPAQDMVLLDDSDNNCRAARALGIRAIKVSPSFPVERAITAALGAIPLPEEWQMEEGRYIREKNVVDGRALSRQVLARLEAELDTLRREEGVGVLRVVDLGAGLLSMLPVLAQAGGKAGWTSGLDYTAYEMNADMVEAAVKQLRLQGYEEDEEEEGGAESVVLRKGQTRVQLVAADFSELRQQASAAAAPRPPHVVVGCCLADLYHPTDLAASLLKLLGGLPARPVLLYLPITFAGQTAVRPSSAGDAEMFDAYHRHLTQHEGHSLDPSALIGALREHGARLLASGPSVWVIDKAGEQVSYLWDTMLYFFGLGVSAVLGPHRTAPWVRRLRTDRPIIEVGNVDLLFRLSADTDLPGLPSPSTASSSPEQPAVTGPMGPPAGDKSKQKDCYIEFIAPRTVRCVEEEWRQEALPPGQVEVQAECSLISSGTELKVYRGDFDDQSAVDVNIKGMASETMAFPLRYGYCLVGRVVRCGEGVDAGRYEGRLVFSFLPHGHRHIVAEEQLMLVPEGIGAEDAVYMPSMETALAIVHDAAPLAGERVAVVGAGLIGLLATAILSRQLGGLASVTAIDPLPRRRELAMVMGASRALHPSQAGGGLDQDVCLELSGVGAGLQTAIDAAGYGAKVVVGSWYGDKPVPLHLGLGFHRSHLRLVVSQVSNISAPLLDRWSKARRFGHTWDLVRALRPSRLLTTRALPPQQASEGYAALDQRPGEEVAVLIRY